ncbi:MAG: glycosyltransferase family 61 protein [Rickettsiales bacterium]|jgi:hypothetical protein|nr:glycosyltransferase family 61 protein [Rickettsiales bacterium]
MNKLLLNICCAFIYKKKNRHHFREKYGKRLSINNNSLRPTTNNDLNTKLILDQIKKIDKRTKIIETQLLKQTIHHKTNYKHVFNSNKHIYGDKKYFEIPFTFGNNKSIENILNGTNLEWRNAKFEIIKNGIIFNVGTYSKYGVYCEDLRPILSSDISMCSYKIDPNFDNKIRGLKPTYLDEEVVFLGLYTNTYGHCIIGSMNRLYSLLNDKYKDKKVVMIMQKHDENLMEIIMLAGINKEKIIKIYPGSSIKFRSVIIPEWTCYWPTFDIRKDFVRNFDNIRKNIQSEYKYEKIFINRTKKNGKKVNGKRIFGEGKIENIFKKNGFTIICPDDYSVMEQVKIFKNCKTLAGISGSGMHNVVFMEDGATDIVINRGYGCNVNAGIDYYKNNTSFYIMNSIITANINNAAGAGNAFCFINENLKNFFDDNEFYYDADDLLFDAEEYIEYANSEELKNQMF